MFKSNKGRTLEYLKIKTRIELLETKEDGEKGIIEAYVSIFGNVDLAGDKIIKGAFAESLQKKLPVGVWMHNWDEPIAKTIEAKEDEKGLYIKAQLIAGVQRADEAYLLLKGGVIDEFSIGYRVLDDEYEEDGTRKLKKIKLYEWSPVLAGCNTETELIGVKEEQDQKKEPKANFIKTEKRSIKVYLNDGTVKEYQITNRYIKYLKSRAQDEVKREKVETPVEGRKVLRIRHVAKQMEKASKYILRITK